MTMEITVNEDKSIRVKAYSKSKLDETYPNLETLQNDFTSAYGRYYQFYARHRIFSYVFKFHDSIPEHEREYYKQHFTLRKQP